MSGSRIRGVGACNETGFALIPGRTVDDLSLTTLLIDPKFTLGLNGLFIMVCSKFFPGSYGSSVSLWLSSIICVLGLVSLLDANENGVYFFMRLAVYLLWSSFDGLIEFRHPKDRFLSYLVFLETEWVLVVKAVRFRPSLDLEFSNKLSLRLGFLSSFSIVWWKVYAMTLGGAWLSVRVRLGLKLVLPLFNTKTSSFLVSDSARVVWEAGFELRFSSKGELCTVSTSTTSVVIIYLLRSSLLNCLVVI